MQATEILVLVTIGTDVNQCHQNQITWNISRYYYNSEISWYVSQFEQRWWLENSIVS